MIRIAIADDHQLVRQGIKTIFEAFPGFQVVGEAATAAEALQLARTGNIDVLLLDLSMPGKSGIDLIKQIKSEVPKLAILVISMHDEGQFAVRSIKAGASGYLSKGGAAEELLVAVQKVATGKPYITPAVADCLAQQAGAMQVQELHHLLSDREFEIFKLIVMGMSGDAMAAELCISKKTVSTYKARILRKMQMSSSSQLIHYAIQHGLSPD